MSGSPDSLLDGSKNFDIWLAISQNRIADALKNIANGLADSKGIFFGVWKKKAKYPDLESVLVAARELLSDKPVPVRAAPTSGLKEAGDHFPEWVRLLCAMQANGHYPGQTDILLQNIQQWLERLSMEVREKAADYPGTAIAGYVWMNGAIIREWCDPLAAVYTQKGDLTGKADTLQLKCKITGAIMGHYPQTLGPDMITAAAALEAIGETLIPKSYYQAIITDFRPIADDIRTAPEEPVTEDDIMTLQALRDAYEGLSRLQGAVVFAGEWAFLETIIKRGVTAQEGVEDDDD